MVLIQNILPRYDIPISNKFELINNSNDDFHYVIYYLTENSFKIIVRRLDNDNGWGVNLKIKIFDDNNFETISIGSNEKNYKIINLYTNNIILGKIKYNIQKIPKIIVQTTANKNIESVLFFNSILSFLELNPEYEYRIYDDKECREFIKMHFDKYILVAYDLLVPGAFKADLFRYCALYINGGCYFDCKHILRKPLREMINSNDYLLLCNDIAPGYYNAVMMSEKNNSHILKAINLCVNKIYNFTVFYNVNNKKFKNIPTILSLTGPVFLYETLKDDINKDEVIKFHHRDKKFHHSYLNLYVEMNGEYIITKSALGYNNNGNETYASLWFKNEILYKNAVFEYNYIFYTYPNNSSDIYKFHIFNENSFIVERVDNNSWANNLKVKIMNDTNSDQLKLTIGNSNDKFKLFDIGYNFFDIKNIVKHFNYSEEFENKFDVRIISQFNKNKLIVKRLDKNIGWKQDLYLNIILLDERYINIHVGNSNNNIKIINTGI